MEKRAMSIDYKKLEEDVRAARKAARVAAESTPDVGSCNLDHVIIPTGRNHPIKRKSAKVAQILDAYTNHLGYSLGGIGRYGQAAKNTLACEAAARELKDWDAYVYYIID
jgi:hypothetical protein